MVVEGRLRVNTLVARLLLRCSRSCLVSKPDVNERRAVPRDDERGREEEEEEEVGERRRKREGEGRRERGFTREGGCLIKQFRYGARRNMRSYPPSLNARFLRGYLSATLRRRQKQRGERGRYSPRRVCIASDVAFSEEISPK